MFEVEGRDRGSGSWEGGSEPSPHQLEGLGERCEFPQRGSGQNPDRKCILDALRGPETGAITPSEAIAVAPSAPSPAGYTYVGSSDGMPIGTGVAALKLVRQLYRLA